MKLFVVFRETVKLFVVICFCCCVVINRWIGDLIV
jgi:hypothetical protein